MQIAKNILNFYIDSSLHVALSVYALIRITFLKLELPYDEAVAYFGFYGTIVGYNFIKYDELARIKKVKLTLLFKGIIALSVLSFFAAFYYFLQLQTVTKVLGVIGLFITILYTLPFFPNKPNLRNWAGIKIYLVALAWVVVTVWLPVLNAEYGFDVVVILKSIQRFIFVFVLMLVFEIIDLQHDADYLKTIPQKIGISATKLLTYFLLVVFVLMDFLKPNVSNSELYIISLVAFLVGGFTYFAKPNRSKYYTSFWVEGIPFFWLLLLWIAFK